MIPGQGKEFETMTYNMIGEALEDGSPAQVAMTVRMLDAEEDPRLSAEAMLALVAGEAIRHPCADGMSDEAAAACVRDRVLDICMDLAMEYDDWMNGIGGDVPDRVPRMFTRVGWTDICGDAGYACRRVTDLARAASAVLSFSDGDPLEDAITVLALTYMRRIYYGHAVQIGMLCDRVYDAVMTVADLRDLP